MIINKVLKRGLPITYLYNEGDQCTSLTGGWVRKYNYDGGTGDLTFASNYMRVSCYRKEGYGYGLITICTVNPLDFSHCRYVYMEYVNSSGTTRRCRIEVSPDKTNANNGTAVGSYGKTSGTISGTFTGISGYKYLTIIYQYTGTDATSTEYLDIKKIWVEGTPLREKATITTVPTAITGQTITGLNTCSLCNAGVCTNGTMYYKAAGSSQTEYGTGIPTVSLPGTYTVYYYAKGDAQHDDSAEGSLTVEVGQLSTLVGTSWTLKESAGRMSGTYSLTFTIANVSGTWTTFYPYHSVSGGGYTAKYIAYKSVSYTSYTIYYYYGRAGSLDENPLPLGSLTRTVYTSGTTTGSVSSYDTTFTVTGGTDATNATLIAWILTNCTRVS